MRPVLNYEDDPHCLALTNQCRRVCLQAGADPTLDLHRELDFSHVALNVGTTVSLEL